VDPARVLDEILSIPFRGLAPTATVGQPLRGNMLRQNKPD
jgi:hypothetical protein